MKEGKRSGIFGGIVLIVIGLLALAAQFIEFGEWLGLLILPALGLIFFAWGIVTRESGLMIPGGILSGLGLGTLLITVGPFADTGGDFQGGIFMLAFALGWFLIPIVSSLVTGDNHWWAVIPGGIIGLIGAASIFGGVAFTALEWLGRFWPVFLILINLYILLRRSKDVAS